MGDSPRLLVFDLSGSMHLPSYLQFLIESWYRQDRDGTLDMVVCPERIEHFGDVAALAEKAPRANVHLMTLNEDEQHRKRVQEHRAKVAANSAPVRSLADVMRGSAAVEPLSFDWQMLCHYAHKLRATHCLVGHIDRYLMLLACEAVPPCPLSGIFFAPLFHYADLGCPPQSEQDRALELHQKLLFARTLRGAQFQRLYLLDPFATEAAAKFPGGEKVTYLPDPVSSERASKSEVATLRTKLAVEPGRSVLLMFGHITARKGCDQSLEALMELPESLCRGICLVIAGFIEPDYLPEFEEKAGRLSARRSVQIVRRFGYVAQQEVASYFGLADVVLTPYQKHPGMSGILLQAAAAGTPVLSSGYGLMGEYVRRHRLGVRVNANDPREIAEGLRALLTGSAGDLFDPAAMTRLVARHDAAQFGAILLDTLLGSGGGSR